MSMMEAQLRESWLNVWQRQEADSMGWDQAAFVQLVEFGLKHRINAVSICPWAVTMRHNPTMFGLMHYPGRTLDALRRRVERISEPRRVEADTSGQGQKEKLKIRKKIQAYADGSGTIMDKPAGCGVAVFEEGHDPVLSFKHLDQGTNNIAELSAIELALQEVPDLSADLVVRSDSEYALGIVRNCGMRVPPHHQALVDRIRADLEMRSRTRLEHVKGHAGTFGNELADALAGCARKHG